MPVRLIALALLTQDVDAAERLDGLRDRRGDLLLEADVADDAASALPPACSISFAAVKIVPGSLGCGSAVFATIATFAPSRAARSPIARPMPRLAPVMNSVFPRRDIRGVYDETPPET